MHVHHLIVGCGYVGGELARRLRSRGETVTAVSRTGVDVDGVDSLEVDVTEPPLDLPDDVDRCYYLVSSGSRGDADAYRRAYVEGQRNTLNALPDTVEYLYSSSTGVYDTNDGSSVDEETPLEPDTPAREVMVEAEAVALDAGGSVVRFAGLYGPDRLSADRYLDGSRVPGGYLNLLRRGDAATAATAALEGGHSLYVAVDDEPVHRHELSRWLAEYTGRDPGELVDEPARSNRRCRNERLRSTGWRPEYPSYREGFADLLD